MKREKAISTIQLDNELVRITKFSFPPGTETGMHKHLFDYIITPITDGKLTLIDKNGNKTRYAYGSSIPSEYDFSKLGEAWSTPRILKIKVNSKDKWVSVFGGGFNNGVNTNYGNAIFVIDMENGGKILKKID